jgi:hypothetical protein
MLSSTSMITIPQLKDDERKDVEFETPDQFVEHNREELGVPAFLRINECRKVCFFNSVETLV